MIFVIACMTRQQKVNQVNSRNKCEKRSFEYWKFLKRVSQLLTGWGQVRRINLGACDPNHHWVWTTIKQFLHRLKGILFHVSLFLRTVWSKVENTIIKGVAFSSATMFLIIFFPWSCYFFLFRLYLHQLSTRSSYANKKKKENERKYKPKSFFSI